MESSNPLKRSTARKRSSKPIYNVTRLLHIYLSMLGFTALLFFSVTGITLNHPDWFYSSAEVEREYTGTLPKEWIPQEDSTNSESSDSAAGIEKLSIVEFFRSTHGIGGAVSEFSVDDYQIIVGFAGPGYAADAFIEREDASYTLTESAFGSLAILNDLHKGRDSGQAWSWVIDLSALVMLIVSLSGLYLLLNLRNRKNTGLLLSVVGTAILVFVYLLWVP